MAARGAPARVRPAANALARRCAVDPPHQAWAADITAFWTRTGWCHLAVVLDLGSRRVVGWALRVRSRPASSSPPCTSR